MKVKDLDFNEYNLKLTGFVSNNPRPKSQLHQTAYKLLKEHFPTCQILEEVAIKIRSYERTKFIDFFVPKFNIVVEVHGQQHYKFNTHFHSSAQDFLNQKKRDQDLIEWCHINNFEYIEFPHYEDQEKWMNRIKK